MKKQGFTLIELMIVVAIIAIIAAIAIPNLLRSRIQSNESAAIGNLRTVLGAQNAYNSANGTYAPDFAALTAVVGNAPAFLDGAWGGTKNGYTFGLGQATPQQFACNANPETVDVTGVRYFFVNESGVIRFNTGGAADSASSPIGEN